MENKPRPDGMRVNLATLRFIGPDKHLEKPYIEYHHESSRRQLRFAMIIGATLIALFAVLDLLMLPDRKFFAWFIRFIVLLPAIGVGIALTFHPKVTRLFPWLQIVLINLVSAGIMGLIITSPPPEDHLYHGGLILVIIYAYSCIKLRFVWASLCGCLTIVAYEIIGWNFTSVPRSIMYSNTFHLVATNFIGMVGCYIIEWNQRKNFILAHNLMKEQEKVSTANALLEKRVSERTVDLEKANKELQLQIGECQRLEEQTRQAQKLESIGLLAGGIAHDFNNILTIIIGNASLIQMKPMAMEKLLHHIDALLTSANRGALLVKQLLTFARKTESVRVPVDINEVGREVCNLLSETFPKNITIDADFADKLPFINADGVQIHQVFMNLCINARDAMPSGGRLSIITGIVPGDAAGKPSPDLPAARYVRIAITDTGCGMDHATQKKIFDPFFTTKEKGKGTGLGLAVVYGIVKAHGGSITVTSEVGRGTEFALFLPAPASVDSAKAGQEPGRQSAIGSGQTILVVEDEIAIRELTKELLETSGYKTLIADNGAQAIEIFRRRKAEIDLVITDKGMPGMDGIEVFHQLRLVKPEVRCLMLTGFLDAADEIRLRQIGSIEILMKPVDSKTLLDTVAKLTKPLV